MPTATVEGRMQFKIIKYLVLERCVEGSIELESVLKMKKRGVCIFAQWWRRLASYKF